jgi:hypothetical protein
VSAAQYDAMITKLGIKNCTIELHMVDATLPVLIPKVPYLLIRLKTLFYGSYG